MSELAKEPTKQPAKAGRLATCPFCGHTVKMRLTTSGTHFVGCDFDGCLMQPRTRSYARRFGATLAWNRRAAPADTHAPWKAPIVPAADDWRKPAQGKEA